MLAGKREPDQPLAGKSTLCRLERTPAKGAEAIDQLLAVRLRQANQDASAGSLPELQRIVARLRTRRPKLKITLRGDFGFCREELMRWCEENQVDRWPNPLYGAAAVVCMSSGYPC